MRRVSCPCGGGDLGGLTMLEDGGLEEVEESLREAARCWPSWATTCLRAASSASRASIRAWSRRQLVQRTASLALMAVYSTSPATAGTKPGNGDRILERRGGEAGDRGFRRQGHEAGFGRLRPARRAGRGLRRRRHAL